MTTPVPRAATGGASSLLARAARREPVERTPVWFMRQAGRVLPEYRAVRERYSLLEICRHPSVCAEVTLQPLQRMPLDAAIVFSDIMLPLVAIGVDLDIVDGVGPVVREPVRSEAAVRALRALEPGDLAALEETIGLVARALHPSRAVLGFAGAPFTLASYLIEGRASRQFVRTKSLMYGQPRLWHALMERLADLAAAALRAQIAAGVDAIQLFDSWIGALSPTDYVAYVRPWTRRVFAALSSLGVPMIHFGVNTAGLLEVMKDDGATLIGLDWRVPLDEGWARVGHHLGVQGNLDPAALLAPRDVLRGMTRDVLARAAGRPGHVFNLGHGILPETPLDQAVALVEMVQDESARLRGRAGQAA